MKILNTRLPNASVQLGGRLHHFDGINTNRTDDGNQVLRPTGILPPLTGVTATPGGAGNVDDGVHQIYVTFVYVVAGAVLVESNPSPVTSVTISSGPKTVALTNVPTSSHPSVTGRKIYVTRAGGNSPVAVTTAVAQIADNTTTSYTYNTSDANLSSIPLLQSNLALPCSPYAVEFANRIILGGGIGKLLNVSFTNASATFSWVSGPELTMGDYGKAIILSGNTAYTIASINETAQTGTLTIAYQGTTSAAGGDTVTIIGDTCQITVGNPLPLNVEAYDPTADTQFLVGQDDGMPLRGIAKLYETLVFGKTRAIYRLVGDLITDSTVGPSYRVDKVTDRVGFASHLTCRNLRGGGLLFYSGDGIYLMQNGDPVKISQALDPLFDPNVTDPILLGGEDCRVDHDYDSVSHAVYDPVRQWYLLWVARQANSTATRKASDLLLMLDFKRKNSKGQPAAWAFIVPASISLAQQDPRTNAFRVLIGTYNSKVLELFTGYRDGVPTISTGSTNYLFKVLTVTAPSGGYKTRLTLSAVAPYGGYQDVTGGSGGLPIVGVSGTRKGRVSMVRSYVTTDVIEVDEELYGTCPFQVNDIITIGGYQALWSSRRDAFGSQSFLKRGSRLKPTFDIPVFTSVDT